MKEPSLWTGRVERATLGTTARWTTNDYGNGHTYAPVHLAGHVDDLVKAAGNEVDELHLSDGTHTDNGCFGHGGIDDALRPKFFQQACAHLECAAIVTHILTEEEDGFITTHLLANGLPDCF